jgi:hypothetical protein
VPEPTEPHDENIAAVYGLFCGVIAVPSAFVFGIGAFFGVMAIILGRGGLRRAREGARREGASVLAILLGVGAVLLAIGIWLT